MSNAGENTMPDSELKEFLDFVDQRKKDLLYKYTHDTEIYQRALTVMEKYEKNKEYISKEDFNKLEQIVEYFMGEGKNPQIAEYISDFMVDRSPAFIQEEAYPMNEEEYEIVIEAAKIIAQYGNRYVDKMSGKKIANTVKLFAVENTSPRITGIAKEEYEIMLENQNKPKENQ